MSMVVTCSPAHCSFTHSFMFIKEGPRDRKQLVQIHSGMSAQKKPPFISCHLDLLSCPSTFTEAQFCAFPSVPWATPVKLVEFPFYLNQGQFLCLAIKDSWLIQEADYVGSYNNNIIVINGQRRRGVVLWMSFYTAIRGKALNASDTGELLIT